MYYISDEVHPFIVNIHIPLNYPLDFYYLMDFSCSMANDLETIQMLSEDIGKYVDIDCHHGVIITVETLGNLTTDFRVGFGAFSDKEALPFSWERKYVIIMLCSCCHGVDRESPFCVHNMERTVPLPRQHVPFDYIHYLSLTDNQTVFIVSDA